MWGLTATVQENKRCKGKPIKNRKQKKKKTYRPNPPGSGGTYCIDQQLKTGLSLIECLKFEPLTLDVLDYMSAGVDVLEQGSNMAAI